MRRHYANACTQPANYFSVEGQPVSVEDRYGLDGAPRSRSALPMPHGLGRLQLQDRMARCRQLQAPDSGSSP